ncbi:MAG TPA: AbrB/MazE/SpoVT family DNA-binding domain-containing protein [Pyrinomonadaceae bacterium]|nr:AbrB/MazE/SpoVT family DNA-binding domain-containing protein [Acidobacteriota bacterium]HQZ96573.1 AbrB/MazE/SpoVT family DNA-binding domain-containing protein [Pyrinomonadaceae bacterium]
MASQNGVFSAILADDGSIAIPEEILQRLNLNDGDDVKLIFDDDAFSTLKSLTPSQSKPADFEIQ